MRNQTRGPRSGGHRSARGRRTPPTCPWGVRRPREGRTPDPSGPGGALGANRPPAGRMTRAGRPRASMTPIGVAGRTVAGGLSSGTVAHGGMDADSPQDRGWTVDADRPGSRLACRESSSGGPVASGPGVHLAGARAEDLGGGLRARISPLGIDRSIAGRMPLPADQPPANITGVGREWHATFAGPVVHLGRGVGDPGPSVALVSDVVCPRQRHFRIPPDPRQRRPPGIRHSGR